MPFVAVQVLVMAAVIAWPSLIRLDSDRRPKLDAETTERVLEHAADAGALYTPGRPRPDPGVLLQQHLREIGVLGGEPSR